MRRAHRFAVAAVAGSLGMIVIPLVQPAGAGDASGARQAQFASAAREFGVPESVLLALSYNESRWEAHHGTPSTTGAYGPMALTDVPATGLTAKGDGFSGPTDSAALHTLPAAAKLIGANPAELKTDEAANIRGAAALLASYARTLNHGSLPSTAGAWYGAVAKYSGAAGESAAQLFADDVYNTIRTGITRHTDDGQIVSLAAQPGIQRDSGQLGALSLDWKPADQEPECSPDLECDFVPAAYAQTGANKTDYGNYDLADRPHKHLTVDYIVVHDTEEPYDSAVAGFQNPATQISAHYIVRGSTGSITQMVRTSNVAYHAGNWYLNMHSVGIEQEGYAVQGATWYTEQLYRTTASLVRYLAERYHISLDRQHILGHDNVPGQAPKNVPAMHWDPGPFWNWNHFMDLLGQHTESSDDPQELSDSPGQVITINPVFADNPQTVTDCEQKQPVPAQAASFVYLRTAPEEKAPLFNDPGLHPTGTADLTCAADWGDKASAGQQFVVAERSGDWTAIWWDGTKVWFKNSADKPVATPASARVVEPKPGVTSVPTYGVAFPEAGEYPADIPAQPITPLPYTIQSGQSYVYGGSTPTDYYYAKTIDSSLPGDHTDVVGKQKYIEIQLGHRIAFVKASDVRVKPAAG